MSNPAVCLLAQNNINGKTLRIEDNLGEAVHIHLGDIRVSLSTSEFDNFYKSVLSATEELLRLEGIDLRSLDITSLDWNWLENYHHLRGITHKNVRLSDLYTVKQQKDGTNKIIKIKDSIFVKALDGNDEELKQYKEVNMHNETTLSRLDSVYNMIKEYGYPNDGKYIMIDKAGRIFDGDHRVACLYKLYGGDYTIPVIELDFDNQYSEIKHFNKAERKARFKQKSKLFARCIIAGPYLILKRVYSLVKGLKRTRRTESISEKTIFSTINEAINHCHENELDYYIIDFPIIYDKYKSDKTLVIKDFDLIKDKFISSDLAYGNYNMLYSVSRPICTHLDECNVLVCDKLCCKSLFENAILPLDKSCNRYAFENFEEKDGVRYANSIVKMISIIMNSMLEHGGFNDESMRFIKANSTLLDDTKLFSLLDKEFFEFTPKLIKLLKENKFDECVSCYESNLEY